MGGVLEVVLPGRGANDWPCGRKGLPGGPEVGEKLYRLTIKWTLSKIVVKDFPCTLRVPFTDWYKSIASYKKVHISQDHSSVSSDITLLHFFI